MRTNTTSITHVRTVTIPVVDQERSLAFYTDVLGFEKRMDVAFGEGQRWIEVVPSDGGTTIALPPRGDVSPGVESLEVKLVTEAEIPWDQLAFTMVRRTLEHFLEDRKTGVFTPRFGDIRPPQR